MKKTHESITEKGSAFSQYKEVIVGSSSTLYFLYFELCLVLTYIPGAVGMVLRKIFWSKLFKSCGKGVLFGTGVILRHPKKIRIGKRVIISDGCILDARNSSNETAISIDDDVMISNNVMFSCKDGSVSVGKTTGINAQTIVQSTNSCPVSIGEDVIIGQQSLIVGGGNYDIELTDVPIRQQGIKRDGGVTISNNVWIGGKVTVLGGVTIGEGSVIGAASVMTKSVSPYSLCRGIPAKIYGNRREKLNE